MSDSSAGEGVWVCMLLLITAKYKTTSIPKKIVNEETAV